MSGDLLLDWVALSISLYNTILLLWLGLTVLLNAERRTWGIWLTGGGLMLGGLFFVSHSAMLGRGLYTPDVGMDFWWHLGWIPVVLLPIAWYVVMLWYAGFFEDPHSRLHRRQRPFLILALLLAIGLVSLLAFGKGLPSYNQLLRLDLAAAPAWHGVPLLILIYPPYSLLCLSLPLDALARPGPSARVMGELARSRARPWLAATSIVLLAANLLVAATMVWLVLGMRFGREAYDSSYSNLPVIMLTTLIRFDAAIDALIAVAITLLGQAVVSYEVFTGKTLPRHGLVRHYRNAIILAAGYGAVMSAGLAIQLRPVYVLLVTAGLVTAFYAMFSWISYDERERAIAGLRPFITSQRLYEQIATHPVSAPLDLDALTPFRALCRDILGAQVAYLVPLGRLAPLAGPPLVYPEGPAPSLPALTEVAKALPSPHAMAVPLDPARFAGARWGVPLWSERGLIGVLLLGPKADGGLYTQEEIEIARASGERLVDTQAAAEIARRLMALQRQRLAETQVLDQRTRRVLHDDVLPRVHAALLSLGEASPDAVAQLTGVHQRLSALLREMPAGGAPEIARLGLLGALRQAVEDELAGSFDGVSWELAPGAEEQARAIPPLTAEVLFYAAREAVRNAARHGRAGDVARPLHLRIAAACRDGLEVTVEDDGFGLGAPPAIDGSGQGLALHSTMLAVVGGALTLDSAPGQYTRVVLALPRAALP